MMMMTVVPSPFQLSVLNDSKMQTCHIKLLNVAIEQEQKGKNAVKSNFTSFYYGDGGFSEDGIFIWKICDYNYQRWSSQ